MKITKLGVIYRQYQVVIVPFPFSEKFFSKKRPAVILTDEAYNSSHPNLVLAMITTAKNSWQSDLKLIDLNISGLLKPCSVRFKIFTLPQSLIDRHLGVLGPLDQKNFKVQLKKVLCL